MSSLYPRSFILSIPFVTKPLFKLSRLYSFELYDPSPTQIKKRFLFSFSKFSPASKYSKIPFPVFRFPTAVTSISSSLRPSSILILLCTLELNFFKSTPLYTKCNFFSSIGSLYFISTIFCLLIANTPSIFL